MSDQPTTPANSPEPPRAGLVKRLLGIPLALPKLALRKPLLGIPLLLAVVGGSVGLWMVLGRGHHEEHGPALGELITQALEALDAGNPALAAELVEPITGEQELKPHEASGLLFVLGALAHRRAESNPQNQRHNALLAAEYFSAANEYGFPAGRETRGCYLLGRNLLLARRIPASRQALELALKLGAEPVAEIHRLLALAYAQGPNADLKQSLVHNAAYLEKSDLLDAERQEAILWRAELQLAAGDTPACRETLAKIPENTSWKLTAEVINVRIRMQESPSDTNVLQECVATLTQVLESPRLMIAADGSASYLLAICHKRLGQTDLAIEEFERCSRRHFNSHEGVAADFEQAELLRAKQSDEKALALYAAVLHPEARLPETPSTWLTPQTVNQGIENAYADFLARRQYQIAIDLAKHARDTLPRDRAVTMAADSHRLWAIELETAAAANPAQNKSNTESQNPSWGHWRRAGRMYLKLADLHFASKEYPEELWRAAECLLKGRDFPATAAVLRRYLQAESRQRQPEAKLALGQSLLAMGRTQEAIRMITGSIESFPRHPSVFSARLILAKAHTNGGNLEAAEQYYRDNLEEGLLTPASQEWQQSLFGVARLLFESRRYSEAIERLEEAVTRYPNDLEATEAHYLIGESCRRGASQIREQFEADATLDGRLNRDREARRLLEMGLQNYELAITGLTNRLARDVLHPAEQKMLRNAYFARGTLMYQLGRFDEAIKAYTMAANRYQQQPEVLDAYLQVASCYRRMGRTAEHRSTLAQAKVVWKRMPENADFVGTTHLTREEWGKLLDSMARL